MEVARKLPPNQETSIRTYVNNRTRLNPPLSDDFFGNCIHTVAVNATSSELLRNGLGCAAWKIHQVVMNHTDKVAREWVESWVKEPFTYKLRHSPYNIQIGSSPRFKIYENEFGLGKALAVRSGFANKFDGKIMFFPGREGGGSTDLEICLPSNSMNCLESDMEFMEMVTSSSVLN
ncbi:hypothetical protein ACH5RR_027184 [Cinchona calisaya]|uniref:Uncharacterized protein n=1 Tax=Cinchona calisaya TaxID=153742 RepID=A0ABD2Z4Q4_9GENT